MKVEVHATKKATREEREIFLQAAVRLGECLSDPIFWKGMKTEYDRAIYKRTALIGEGVRNPTFEEFKALVLSGRDKFNKESDEDIDVSVEFYFSRKRVVGYTYPTTWFTWINRNVFKNYDIGDIAGNIFHEYMHNLGYGHPGASRDSLTYILGYFTRDFINKPSYVREVYMGATPVKTIRRGFFSRVKSFFRRLF